MTRQSLNVLLAEPLVP